MCLRESCSLEEEKNEKHAHKQMKILVSAVIGIVKIRVRGIYLGHQRGRHLRRDQKGGEELALHGLGKATQVEAADA